MKNFALIFSLLLAMLEASCSDGKSGVAGGSTGDSGIKNVPVMGLAQKGPFIAGSTVKLFEIDENGSQTGNTYTGAVESDDGAFSFGKVNLSYSIALLEVNGFYWNELGDVNSESPITLNAIVDLSNKSTVNVNLGTHLVYERIRKLMDQGMAFAKAKSQAESELLEVFSEEPLSDGFDSKDIFDDAPLMAISIMFLSLGNESVMTENLKKFSLDFAKDGTLDNDTLRARLADGVVQMDSWGGLPIIQKNIESRKDGAEGLAFVSHLARYWGETLKLGECSEDNEFEVKANSNELSLLFGEPFICDSARWRLASDSYLDRAFYERNVKGLPEGEDGEIRSGVVDTTTLLVYDDGAWRFMTDAETLKMAGCTKARNGEIVTVGDEDYTCVRKVIPVYNQQTMDTTYELKIEWMLPSIFKYEKDSLFNPDVAYDSLVDARDGNVYRTVKIGDLTWMAENLRYGTTKAYEIVCVGKRVPDKQTCDNIGYGYDWYVATGAENRKPARVDSTDPVLRGLCPEGWRIPSEEEFKKLLEYAGGLSALKSAKGWAHRGTNSTGFSAVPTTTMSIYNDLILFLPEFDMILAQQTTDVEGKVVWYSLCANVIDNLVLYDSCKDVNVYDARYGSSIRCVKD